MCSGPLLGLLENKLNCIVKIAIVSLTHTILTSTYSLKYKTAPKNISKTHPNRISPYIFHLQYENVHPIQKKSHPLARFYGRSSTEYIPNHHRKRCEASTTPLPFRTKRFVRLRFVGFLSIYIV